MAGSGCRVYFLANVCHVCKSKDTPYACEICRMIFYCSVEHRRVNWIEHSRLCWALNKVCQTGNGEHVYDMSAGRELTGFKHEVARGCVRVLGRGLEPWELEMIYHPRVCNVCHQADWKKLQPCKGCEFVYTCDQAHFRKDHPKWCKTFRIYWEMIMKESNDDRKCRIGDFQPEIKNGVHGSMAEVLSQSCHTKDKDCLDGEVRKALISDLLTYPLTVLNGLNAIKSSNQEAIRILFVGAEIQAEVQPTEKWEKYFLHHLTHVKILNLVFLGPELRMPENRERMESLCEECRSQRKEIRWEFASGKLYHDYIRPETPKPDLICAMNSGMYRDFGFRNENSWEPTIRSLFTRDTARAPVLITEYTRHELNEDLKRIKSVCGKVKSVLGPEKNPFASLKPGLNIISEPETPFIFKNHYHVILRPGERKMEGEHDEKNHTHGKFS